MMLGYANDYFFSSYFFLPMISIFFARADFLTAWHTVVE